MTSSRLLAFTLTALNFAAPAFGQLAPAFVPPALFAAPGATSAATGDFNGDGRIDIATANGAPAGSHGVSILLSNGDGSFQAARNFNTGTDPNAIAVGDFNADGKLDAAVMNSLQSTVSILTGNGDGTLQAPSLIVLPGVPRSLASADFNSDGKTDLILSVSLAAPGSSLTVVLMSRGDGTFAQSTFPSPYGIVVADFNGDGKPDIAQYGIPTGPGAAIKFGNGDGTFTDAPLPFTLGVPFQVTQAVAGDLNGDGKMDLYGEFVSGAITRSGFVFSTYVALGNGDGTFTVNSTGLFSVGIGGENLLAGDFNGDGKLDIAGVFPGPSANNIGPRNLPNTIRVLYGTGNGSFAVRTSYAAGPSLGIAAANCLVAGDFDGNGSTDFAWATGAGINVVRNGSGNPPLLTGISLNSNFVQGGSAVVAGSLSLGAPAPAGGASVSLTSSNPAAAFFPGGPTVFIPAGATSAAFSVSTLAVAAPALVTVNSVLNGVTQTASLNVDPAFTLNSLSFAPASLIGYFGNFGPLFNYATATITLSGPATDAGALVNLTSSNPALVSVPPSVTVAPGATSATFFAGNLNKVAANTPVTIAASLQGVSRSGILTVLTGADIVQITKAEYVVKTGQWKIEATDSDPSVTTIWVLDSAGTFKGSLTNLGAGAFKGQGASAGPFTSVVLQSIKGGNVSGPVAQK